MAGDERPVVPVIVGSTGVGKTAVTIELARLVPLTIISADARQVYRGLDIGTAKPPVEVRARVPHRGIDLIDPGEQYSAGRFAREAAGWLEEARRERREPLVAGGTGFYVRALAEGLFKEPPLDAARRDALRQWAATLSPVAAAHWAARLDRGFAGGGRQRAVRAIEVALLTGRPLSFWQRDARETGPLQPWYVHLTLPRDALERRITERVDRMLLAGFVDEVRSLLAAGVPRGAPGLDAVGYREVVALLSGGLPASGLREAIVISTRRYAKRQDTWFRHQLAGTHRSLPGPIRWVLDATESPARLAARIFERWHRQLGLMLRGSGANA